MTDENSMPNVSIIIPTYDRVKYLKQTIQSFVALSYPQNKYEILVCDNNSSDETAQAVLEFTKRYPGLVKYLFEPRQGVHFARNTAAKLARGDILYFTDDDIIADPNLLTSLVPVFSADPQIASATGLVLPKWEEPPPDWILKHCQNGWLSLFPEFEDNVVIKSKHSDTPSCHQAIRKAVFFKTKGFHPENTAGTWIGDGETGLNLTIEELGYLFAFVRSSVVYHIIPAERLTQKYLNKRLANQGRADSFTNYRKHRYTRAQLLKRCLQFVYIAAKKTARACRYYICRDDRWHLERAFVDYCFSTISFNTQLFLSKERRAFVAKDDWLNEPAP